MYRIGEVDGAEYAEELEALHNAVFAPAEAYMPDFADGYWWIAFAEDHPVAFIGIQQSTQGAHVGYFTRVGVIRTHRGNRLQLRLTRAMHAKARKVGWTNVVTDTRDNPHSANNIAASGYRMFTPTSPWCRLEDTLYWKKDL